MATFAYNIAQPELPLTPRVAPVGVPRPQVPFVNPGGNITLGEFVGGGARPNMYGVYDPAGAANLRSVLPYASALGEEAEFARDMASPSGVKSFTQSLRSNPLLPGTTGYGPPNPYRPGQYSLRDVQNAQRFGLPAPSNTPSAASSSLAIRPNTAPSVVEPMPGGAPAMKPAQVLNVRTIPGTGGASAAPMLEAGGAGRAAGVGSRLAGMGSMVGKALPFVGDVLQGVAYGMDPNSNASTMGRIGRGVVAGLGSLGGRLAGAAGGTLVAPGVGTAVGSVGGSIGGAAGAAQLYDSLMESAPAAPAPLTAADKGMNLPTPAENQAYFRQKAAEVEATDPRKAAAFNLTAARATDPRQVNPETRAAAEAVSQGADKAASQSGAFQGPSAEEKARFRKQTGTPYDPNSITDKLNLERMRAGEQTFTSKQSREYRRANPSYRPGQYSSGGSMAVSPQTPAASSVRAPIAPMAPTPNMTLEQRGLARTVSVSDPVMGVTRNTSPRPTPAQTGAAIRDDYYRRIRESRATNPHSRVRYAGQ